MRSPVQQALLVSLGSILRPLARLMLQCGLGFDEFAAVAKSAFVSEATDKYGIRGRPTNISRVSALTGISRKEVSRIRASSPLEQRWTPDLETNPINTVLHHWHFDPEFSTAPGSPKALASEGASSFAALVARYAGDVPYGAIRAELVRSGTVTEELGLLVVTRRFFSSPRFDEDLIRRIAFSLSNLGETLVHNVQLYQNTTISDEQSATSGRLERAAWTQHLSQEHARQFRVWIRDKGIRFIEDADAWLGAHELPRNVWDSKRTCRLGIGVYYFEEDDPPK
jgi:hypothetical protein